MMPSSSDNHCSAWLNMTKLSFLDLFQHDRRVVTTNAEIRAEGDLQLLGAARLADDVVELCAFLGQLVEVTHRWHHSLFYRERTDGGLYRPCGPQRVSQSGFCCRDHGVRVYGVHGV